jgi:hypothetical protein
VKLKKTAVAVAATGLVALAGPAWSAGPYDIAVNGDTSGTQYDFVATSTDSHFQVLAFGFIPVDMYCDTVEFTGTVNTGAGVSGANAATMTGSTWSNCDYNGNLVVVTPDHTPAWALNATGTATSGTTDVVAGDASGINVNVDVSSPACNFDVTGFADLSLDEANQSLEVNENSGNLQISNPGCSLFGQGDPASFDATFDVVTKDASGNPIPGTAVTIS